jgi:hypothetical protein
MSDHPDHVSSPSIRVFCSYAHRDERYRRCLEIGLKPLRRAGRSIQGVAEGRFSWWSLTENASVTDGDTGRAYRRVTLHFDKGAGEQRDDERIFVADGSGPYEAVRTWRRFA